MTAAVDLIISHIKSGDKIMIYGDYDADGVTSSALLYDILQIFKAQVDFYLPDRISEGYGLNKSAIDEIKKSGFSLIITVDNGIRNREEVAYAKSLGLDVIITDHHSYPEGENSLPECLLINPASSVFGLIISLTTGVGLVLASTGLTTLSNHSSQAAMISAACVLPLFLSLIKLSANLRVDTL
jgi:single-stranded-DNA-specific exonuclease